MSRYGAALVVVGVAFAVGVESPAGATATSPSADAAPSAETESPSRLRVVAAGSEPFVTDAGGEIGGLSVEIWAQVATELGLQYDLASLPSVAAAIDRVAAGQADLAIGPITITAARSERVAFSQPYFQSSLGILAERSRSRFDTIKPFLTLAFATGLGFLVLVLGIVGTAIWLAERRKNPEQFPPRPASGIANGIWMALVTMTTVGYGDRVPKTGTGRVLTGGWMLLSIIITSSLVAFIASALTLAQLDRPAISNAEELRGQRVATVANTPGADFAASKGARVLAAPDLETAIAALNRGKADAVVFDRPMLRHYLRAHPEIDLQVAETGYQPQGYGFAMARDTARLSAIDTTLLRLQEAGRLRNAAQRWLGP